MRTRQQYRDSKQSPTGHENDTMLRMLRVAPVVGETDGDVDGDDLGVGEVGEKVCECGRELRSSEATVVENDGDPTLGAAVDACYVSHGVTVTQSCSLPVGERTEVFIESSG